MNRDEALGVIDALYAAALGEAAWNAALALMAKSLDSSAGTLEIHAADGKLLHFDSFGVDPDSIDVYMKDFSWNSRAMFMTQARDLVGFDHLFLSEQEMDRDPFYAEFLAPAGLRYFVSAHTKLIAGRVKGTVSIQRSGKNRGVAVEHVKAMRLLQPHIARAVNLYWTRRRNDIDPSHFDCLLANFGLTAAERRLAMAMASGEALPDYARRAQLSINTVYTHYRRAKDKFGLERQSEFVAALCHLGSTTHGLEEPASFALPPGKLADEASDRHEETTRLGKTFQDH
jgi:DNA-binding CsgD family transcriptional regulator